MIAACPAPDRLLVADDPAPVLEITGQPTSRFVIAVDHAGRRIPARLGDLGLPLRERERHIAWDIGALAVALKVAERLGATVLAQTYSRLVIDCNRDPSVPSSIPEHSDGTLIPGNVGLDPSAAAARRAAIFDPYHARLTAILDRRKAEGRPTILVAQHSMTDRIDGQHRAMHAAILYNRDRRFAGLVLDALRRDAALTVADNQPYFVSDETDYTIPHHGEARGLPHVEIEIRQDLIGQEAGQANWAERIALALCDAERRMPPDWL